MNLLLAFNQRRPLLEVAAAVVDHVNGGECDGEAGGQTNQTVERHLHRAREREDPLRVEKKAEATRREHCGAKGEQQRAAGELSVLVDPEHNGGAHHQEENAKVEGEERVQPVSERDELSGTRCCCFCCWYRC